MRGLDNLFAYKSNDRLHYMWWEFSKNYTILAFVLFMFYVVGRKN